MKPKLFIVIFVALSAQAFANPKHLLIHVNGMVCAFCSQGLTKKFKAEPNVNDVKVNLDEKVVKLTLKEGSEISNEKVNDIITSAGFNVEKIDRD